MYVCPDCKTPLAQLYCESCSHRYSRMDDTPVLLSQSREFSVANDIASIYDSIYREHDNVWKEQAGRTEEFITYFSALLEDCGDGRLLEIGCGEGYLLSRLRAREKYATELSSRAIQAARSRTDAEFCFALAERLPFEAEYFDLVVAVGIMEHFLSDREALGEIGRVLRPGGVFVNLIHVHLTVWDRTRQKIAEYVFPRPRPIQFVHWLLRALRPQAKRTSSVRQPVQNVYTTRGVKLSLEHAGFAVKEVIHTRKNPNLPLEGPWVVILVGQK